MIVVAVFFLGACLFGLILLFSRYAACGARGLSVVDLRDSTLGGLIWPIVVGALVVALVARWCDRLLPSAPGRFFDRLPDGRLAAALSVRDIIRETSPEEQDASIIVIIGGIGKVRIAAKCGLCSATYETDGGIQNVREMTFIGEVALPYLMPEKAND